jgi:hypothetical protein
MTAIKDKYTQYYKKCIDDEHYKAFPKYTGDELRKIHKMKRTADNITDLKQGNNTHCFFTVNFKPEFSTEEKAQEVDKELAEFMDKCKFTGDKYMYAIEQRGETPDTVNGIHAHILFEKGSNAPSKIQRAFKTKFFDKYVGSPACLDYRYITQDRVDQKIDYMLGVKQKDKMVKVNNDRIIRPLWGIKQFYQNNMYSLIKPRIDDNKLKEHFYDYKWN